MNNDKYQFSSVIIEKAKDFIEFCLKNELKISLIDHSIRTYSIKLKCEGINGGKLILDYSTKRHSFNLRTENITDNALSNKYLSLWQEFILGNSPPPKYNSATSNLPVLYTTGSISKSSLLYAYIVVGDGKEICSGSGCITSPEIEPTEMNSTATKTRPIIKGIEQCRIHQMPELLVLYDYDNLPQWYSSDYNANTNESRFFVSSLKQSGIKVRWVKKIESQYDPYIDKVSKVVKNLVEKDTESSVVTENFVRICNNFLSELKENNYAHTEVKMLPQHTPACNISFCDSQSRINILSIYLKKNGNLSVSFNGILDSELRNIKQLWNSYELTFKLAFEKHDNNKFKLLDYYYNILHPFAEYRFDFSLLAVELAKFYPEEKEEILLKAHSFTDLENFYKLIPRAND